MAGGGQVGVSFTSSKPQLSVKAPRWAGSCSDLPWNHWCHHTRGGVNQSFLPGFISSKSCRSFQQTKESSFRIISPERERERESARMLSHPLHIMTTQVREEFSAIRMGQRDS